MRKGFKYLIISLVFLILALLFVPAFLTALQGGHP